MEKREYKKKIPPIVNALANEAITKYYKDINRAKEEGKLIAWTGLGLGSLFLYAFDIVPVYPQLHVTFQAVRDKYIERTSHLEGKWELPSDLCGEIKAMIGNILMGDPLALQMPSPDLLISLNSVCYQLPKGFEFISKYLNVPCYLFDCPYSSDLSFNNASVMYIKSQIKNIIYEIEKKFKVKFNETKLNEYGDFILKRTIIWLEILKLCRFAPAPIDAQDLAFFPIFLLISLPDGNESVLNVYLTLYNELFKIIEENKAASIKKERHRILLDVLPIYHKKNFIKNILTRYDASIVMCSYLISSLSPDKIKDLLFNYPITSEKVERCSKDNNILLELYGIDRNKMDIFEILARLFTSEADFRKGIPYQQKKMKDMIKEYDVDAVIMHMNRSCRVTSISQQYMMNYIKDELHIPVMMFDADTMDSRRFSAAQITTRFEAFMERLEHV